MLEYCVCLEVVEVTSPPAQEETHRRSACLDPVIIDAAIAKSFNDAPVQVHQIQETGQAVLLFVAIEALYGWRIVPKLTTVVRLKDRRRMANY